MVLPIGPIITGVGSIIGGLMGGEEKTNTRSKQRTKSHSSSTSNSRTTGHLGQMVRAAERNGFNPLTLLRAGGLASYSSTSTSSFGKSLTNSKGKNSGSSSSTAPLAAGIAGAAAAIGGAVSEGSQQAAGAANAWQAGQPVGAQSEYDMLQGALNNVQPGAVGTQPRVPVSQVEKTTAGALDGKLPPAKQVADVTDPYSADLPLYPDPLTPDGGTRYESEIAETIKDAHTFYRDMKYSLEQWNVNARKLQAENALPAGANEAIDALVGNPLGGNLWDPPAIKLYTPPVIQQKSQADLYYRAPY